MPDAHPDIPARAPAAVSVDDTILPFQVEALDLRGRVVRFGPAIDTILSRHNYPPPVAKLVPLPRDLRRGGIERYGFHGLSYEYIASALPEVAPELAEWSMLFESGASRRARAEAGIRDAASGRDADDLLRDVGMFLRIVERLLQLQPVLPQVRPDAG